MSDPQEPIVLVYKPRPDEFVQGVPQRDLTKTDIANIAPFELATATASGLYVKPEKPKADDKASAAPGKGDDKP